MAEVLKARAASFVDDDGAEVLYTTGPLPDDAPKAHIDALREQGALAEADEPTALDVTNAGPVGPAALDAPGSVDPDPDLPAPPGDPSQPTSELSAGAESGTPPGAESGGSTADRSTLADDAPDAETADVATLAEYIDSADLNASQTVALAGGTPEGARKVMEAEQTAAGGDGRKTVMEPLGKVAEGDSG
jgi:hypothetical protein